MRHASHESLLTSSDVAKLIDRTPATVRQAAAAGRLKVAATTAGGTRLFTQADVEAYLLERRAATARRSRGERA